MALVDVAAVCTLPFLSTGSYLVLGLLAFLPFFIATQTGPRAAALSLAAITSGGIAVVADPVYREQLSTGSTITLVSMLALLCLCSFTVSRVQQRRLASVAGLTASRSLLLADVMSAEERERRRIAETLHDGALQTVLAVKQDLRAAIRSDRGPADIERASELLGDVSRDLRYVTRELHPSVLDEAGLADAIRALAQGFSDRTGIPLECSIDYPDRHPEDTTVYGIVRELLANIARHADAKTVWLDLTGDGVTAVLDVRDDGVGMDEAVIARRVSEGHIGLASHRARIETQGGAMEFRPVARGTWVHVTVPLTVGQEAM
jgi:two-component system NarL family sensor kinase